MAENVFDDKKAVQTNKIAGDAGSLELNTMIEVDPVGSKLTLDKSYVLLRDKFENFIALKAGGIIHRSIGDLNVDVQKNLAMSVKGDSQYVYNNCYITATGDYKVIQGDHSDKARTASKNLQSTISAIQDKKIQAFENAEPSQVACPICKQKATTERASAIAGNILRTLHKYVFPWDSFDVKKLNKYVSMFIVPFLSVTTNLSLAGGKSCGHPNCNQGVIKTNGNNFEAANQTAASELHAQQDTITGYEKDISANVTVEHSTGDWIKKVGLVKNDAKAYAKGLGPIVCSGFGADGKKDLHLIQKNVAKNLNHHIGVDSKPGGSIEFDACEKIRLSAGSPGLEIETTGHASIHAGSVDLVSTDSELNIASNGLTTLKGKIIKLDANDRSGDSVVNIDATNTFVQHLLSVGGDLALKGSLIMDGAIYAPTLVTRSTEYKTEPATSNKAVNHSPNWNTPPPLTNGNQATVYNNFQHTLDTLNLIIDGFDYILSLSWLTNTIMKAINHAKVNIPLDNEGLPTGYAMIYDYTKFLPVEVFPVNGTGLPNMYASTFPVVGVGMVRPAMIPIFNAPHNHPNVSGDHHHWHEGPAMVTYTGVDGLQANRPNPSHIPTPAPKPTGQEPGPQTMGGACGGGGAAFAKATNSRNAAYGIAGNDPYNGNNYVNATATFNPDGTLNPQPTSSTQYRCD